MRFERYEVIVRKLENVCIEHNIHDEFSISKKICEFDMLTRPYFEQSDIHSYDNEGYDIYNISTVVTAFRWFLTNKSEFKKLLEIEGYICRINLENKLFDLIYKRFEYNEDYYRYCEKLCCLFDNMFVSKIDEYEYEIDVVKNGLGTLMYNELQIVELFENFMSYIDEYEIDVDLALEHMRKGA